MSRGTVSSAQPRYVTLLMWPFMSMSERRATCKTLGCVVCFGSHKFQIVEINHNEFALDEESMETCDQLIETHTEGVSQ